MEPENIFPLEKEKHLLETIIFRFHVKLWYPSMLYVATPSWISEKQLVFYAPTSSTPQGETFGGGG